VVAEPKLLTAAELNEIEARGLKRATLGHWNALLAQARRAIELEARLSALACPMPGCDGDLGCALHGTGARAIVLEARVAELEGWNENQAEQIVTLERVLTTEEGLAIDEKERADAAEKRITELETQLTELEALRALEKHVRSKAVSGCWYTTLGGLLKAVDEAREKKA
jgi:hypothetical protein